MVTGGVGPWLPFQMLGAAWVGFGAGCLPRANGRGEVAIVAAYGAFAGIAYGFLLNLWFWPFTADLPTRFSYVPGATIADNLHHFLAFCIATSLGFDVPRAIGNVVLVLAVGGPIMRALRRASRKANFDAAPPFHEPELVAHE